MEPEIIGDLRYEETHNPSTVKAGELLRVRFPQLPKDMCLIPNSVNLAFEFKVTGTKATCVNNLAKALVKKFVVKYGGKPLYKNIDENTYSLFRDLWQSNEERQRKRANRIMTESMRKKISGDDTYQTSTAVEGLYKFFGSTLEYNLVKFLKTVDCLLCVPFEKNLNSKYVLRLTRKF